MSFKKKKPSVSAPSSPVGLLPLLTRRNIPDAMSHQKEMLAAYADKMVEEPDVAMQLPTGSGKTLVGLLIAEWRRRKFNERVVYLCPTRQLVNQVVEQAETEYGIDAVAFTGSKYKYSPADRSDYTTRAKLAVTTYSSLFNRYPFFEDPETVLLDDAHAAENYVAKMWSLEIPNGDEDYASLHSALSGIFKDHIPGLSYRRLTGDWEDSFDATWVDKLPTETVLELTERIVDAVDAHENVTDKVKYTWPLLRDHLHACHIYLASREILIRPLVPPTWKHAPFQNAKQRIYMSATLGAGGDLERLTGRAKIARIEAPEDFRKAGVGRRLFMFPGLSLEQDACEDLRKKMQKHAGRSVVLTPHSGAAEAVANQFDDEDEFEIFTAEDIEASKKAFVESEKAVAILAGRFDGIDFPNDDCRLLCLDGLPKATNAQERFLMSKMGASVLLNDRMQTRVLQAAGRCTRALQDRSTVFVTGGELVDYLTNAKKWQHFHPELQAELAFGVLQSKDVKADDLMGYFKSFIANDEDWDGANSDIVDDASNLLQEPFPAMDELAAVVPHEVEYQKALWGGNSERALEEARAVISKLNARSLSGYRALWHYLAGSTAQTLSAETGDQFDKVAREQFAKAVNAAPNVPWLVQLMRGETNDSVSVKAHTVDVISQVERLEGVLLALGTADDKKFEKRAKTILNGLADPKKFEEAQRQLGELLGFVAGNGNGDANPDPWWLGDTIGIVFEDHADGSAKTVFGANKAKQAAGHPAWLAEYCAEAEGLDVTAVLITPCTKAGKGAKPALKNIRYWSPEKFEVWAKEAINTVRSLKASLPQEGDLLWRQEAAEKLADTGLTLNAILEVLPVAADEMTIELK
jgi:hypothetical protein